MKALLGAALSALLLAGCAASPEQRAKSAPGAVQVAPEQGLLALKITTNRPMVSQFFAKWTTLNIRNSETKEAFTLIDRADSSAGHSLFVHPLPAGQYAIEGVFNSAVGAMTITSGADASKAFPTFRVAAGQLTDLGSLAYIRKHFPQTTRAFKWGQVDSPLDRQALLRQLEPAMAARLEARPVLGWDDGEVMADARKTFAQERRLTMRALTSAALSDGSLMFGESFGQIAVRNPSGEWRWIDTPTALPIRALQIDEDGSLYAGSDEAILLKRAPGASEWQRLQLPVTDGSILYIGSTPGARDLFVVVQGRDRFVGLSTSRTSPGQWNEQFSRPRALFVNAQMDAHGRVFAAGDRLFLATGSAEAQREITWYDRASRTWKVNALADKGMTTGWVAFGDGSVGYFAGIPLTGMYFNTSPDYGTTWEKRGELNWTSVAPLMFVSDTTGFVVRSEGMPTGNAEFGVWRTDDGGRTWGKGGPLPTLFGTLVALRGAEQVAFASANGKFLVSSDGGKTWRLEREVP
jgi:hypothetical protein